MFAATSPPDSQAAVALCGRFSAAHRCALFGEGSSFAQKCPSSPPPQGCALVLRPIRPFRHIIASLKRQAPPSRGYAARTWTAARRAFVRLLPQQESTGHSAMDGVSVSHRQTTRRLGRTKQQENPAAAGAFKMRDYNPSSLFFPVPPFAPPARLQTSRPHCETSCGGRSL